MPTEHDLIVELLFDWIKVYCHKQKNHYNIYVDHCSPSRSYRPPDISGSIPDVYALSDDGSVVIVGEAETEETLLSHHTENQFIAFLNYCRRFSNSVLLLGVPWVVSVRAHMVLKAIREEENCHSVGCFVLNTWELSNAKGVLTVGKTISLCKSCSLDMVAKPIFAKNGENCSLNRKFGT